MRCPGVPNKVFDECMVLTVQYDVQIQSISGEIDVCLISFTPKYCPSWDLKICLINTGGWKSFLRASPCSHVVSEARVATRAFTQGLGTLRFHLLAFNPHPKRREKLEIQDAGQQPVGKVKREPQVMWSWCMQKPCANLHTKDQLVPFSVGGLLLLTARKGFVSFLSFFSSFFVFFFLSSFQTREEVMMEGWMAAGEMGLVWDGMVCPGYVNIV